MALSVYKNPSGPFWPLGCIAVVTPGTPVRMTSLVDPTGVNAPESATSATSMEYTPRAQQIYIQGMKVSGSGLANNTGNIYVCLRGAGGGSGNRTDTGCIVLTVPAGQTGVIASAAMNRDVFSPYQLFIDADTAGDSAMVTLVIQ